MFILELTLQGTSATLTLQKKEAEDAETTYRSITSAMQSSSAQLLELICDHQGGKKISVFGSSIVAVQVYEKNSGGSSGRTPGFFAPKES